MAKEVVKAKFPVLEIEAITKALMYGDLSKLNETERLHHYKSVCESVGLNPLTNPLQYMTLNNKLVLYAGKNTTEQLRANYGVSVEVTSREKVDEIYVVTAKASLPSGRCDESTGAVNIKGLHGNDLANAFMKAETKAKRRVTLSICGLGMLDETEIETIKQTPPNPFIVNNPPKKVLLKQPVEPDSAPICKTCEAEMLISKSGKHYYCANWQDGNKHDLVGIKLKPKKEEIEEPQEAMREPGDDDFPAFDQFPE